MSCRLFFYLECNAKLAPVARSRDRSPLPMLWRDGLELRWRDGGDPRQALLLPPWRPGSRAGRAGGILVVAEVRSGRGNRGRGRDPRRCEVGRGTAAAAAAAAGRGTEGCGRRRSRQGGLRGALVVEVEGRNGGRGELQVLDGAMLYAPIYTGELTVGGDVMLQSSSSLSCRALHALGALYVKSSSSVYATAQHGSTLLNVSSIFVSSNSDVSDLSSLTVSGDATFEGSIWSRNGMRIRIGGRLLLSTLGSIRAGSLDLAASDLEVHGTAQAADIGGAGGACVLLNCSAHSVDDVSSTPALTMILRVGNLLLVSL